MQQEGFLGGVTKKFDLGGGEGGGGRGGQRLGGGGIPGPPSSV